MVSERVALNARAIALALCVAGCGEGQPQQFWSSNLNAWADLEQARDPLPDHRPVADACPGWWLEDDLVEVDTDACDYFTIAQPVTRPFDRGATLTAGFIHDGLVSVSGPATTHAAIVLDSNVVWETTFELPQPPGFTPIEEAIEDPIVEGALLTLHLHNHGANAYRWEPIMISSGSR